MKKNILSIVLFLAVHFMMTGQGVDLINELVNENDTVVFILNDYIGEIQWQSSPDTLSWTDLEGENSDSLRIIVHDNLYFRAMVTVGICDPFYSEIAYIDNAWNNDNDADGFSRNQGDCNDSIPEINPGATEIPNNDVDEDCDGIALIIDADNDGYNSDEDCNDLDSLIHPGATENECCDGIDQNCDGFDCPINYDILDTVCGGNPLNCSGIYDEADDFYKIILLNSDGNEHYWNSDLPPYYQPHEKDEVELVACIDVSWNTIQTCSYGDGGLYKLYRNKNEVSISIYIASTGDLLDSKTFYGGEPEACLSSEFFTSYVKIKSGSAVVYADVEEWLLGNLKIPIIITKEISEITNNSANCFSEVLREDGFLVTERGICWSTSPTPTVDDNKIPSGLGLGPFGVELAGLNSLSMYYVRAYAITNGGRIIYGEEKRFTTLGIFTDSRDNINYTTIQIGSQIWMAENLAYLPEVCSGNSDCGYFVYDFEDNSVSGAKATDNYKTYGVLYNFESALEACPSNWHLPSDDEWKQLEMYLGMSKAEADDEGCRGTNEGGKLKEAGTSHWIGPNTGATNQSGFTALPGGNRNYTGSDWYISEEGNWWSSSEGSTDMAFMRSLDRIRASVCRQDRFKKIGYSVRCVKD